MTHDDPNAPDAHIITPDGEFADDILVPRVAYGLHGLGMLTGFFHLAAAVVAYINRAEAPDWMRTHYTFQIRTFWIGLLFSIVSISTLWLFGLGILLGFLTWVWFVIRIAVGWSSLERRRPVPDPESWLFGS